MKKLLTTIVLAAGMLALGSASAADQSTSNGSKSAAQSLEQLLQQVKQEQSKAAVMNRQRERKFIEARDKQREILATAKQALAQEQARSNRLQGTFDANEKALNQLTDQLHTREGNLGEVFGVVRQVAGDVKATIDNSLVSAQYPDRGQFLQKLAQAKELPSIDELQQLWYTMQQEMTKQGNVVRFQTNVTLADGTQEKTNVVRVGVFDAVTGDKFLRFLPETSSLVALARQPASRFTDMASDLYEAKTGIVEMAVDPTRGGLLGLLVQEPTFGERIQQGQLPGYTILVLGAIGLLIVIERAIYLLIVGRKMKNQMKTSKPSLDNPLGRVLNVYTENKTDDVDTLELKLDEAILKETPALEARQNIIALIAAIGPLLGLLGTVIGMIQTFQSITLFGTGDPKLMANGISEALVTTVEGLCIAIPLVLCHSFIAGRSASLVQVLEEQSAGMIAEQAEKLSSRPEARK